MYISAFYDLSPARSHSETPQPLSFGDIITYGKLSGILSGRDLLFFYRMIRVCDEAYLTHHHENKETEN